MALSWVMDQVAAPALRLFPQVFRRRALCFGGVQIEMSRDHVN
jgi:hypothetical protein